MTANETKEVMYIVINLVQITAIVTFFVTSAMISLLVSDFVPVRGEFSARQNWFDQPALSVRLEPSLPD
ncbi:MAG TPA: hypothetical protein VGC14_17400 [Rhizobium sp.]